MPAKSSSLFSKVILLPGAKPPAEFEKLAGAATQDLEEIWGEFRLILRRVDHDELAKAIQSQDATLIVYDDWLNPMPVLIEGMLEAFGEFDLVAGPSFDGRIYALVLDGTLIGKDQAEEWATFLLKKPRVEEVIEWSERYGLRHFWQAPWYSGWDQATLDFARQHMKALESSEDPEFTALHTSSEFAKISSKG